MGMIGRWIDEKCRTHPAAMRRVLGRRFGDLQKFSKDGHGCLIGTFELETLGLVQLGRSQADQRVGYAVATLTRSYATPSQGLAAVYRAFPHFCGRRKRDDAVVVRLLKQRIRRSLGLAPAGRALAEEGAL